MPRTWHEQRQLLLVAFTLWRDGCFHDGPLERAGRGESPSQKDVCQRTIESRDRSGSHGKKVVKPSHRKLMVLEDVKKRAPKKALILILGAMLRIMVSIDLVLVSDSLARYRQK